MNPYQKVAVLVLRFAALLGLVTGIGQIAFWAATLSALSQGNTETNWLGIFPGGLRGPLMIAALWAGSSLFLLLLSRPLGRAMGRDLGSQ